MIYKAEEIKKRSSKLTNTVKELLKEPEENKQDLTQEQIRMLFQIKKELKFINQRAKELQHNLIYINGMIY